MANFNTMKLTEQGIRMQTQLQFGGTITFTKVMVGDGNPDDISKMTELVSPVDADISIVGNKILGDGKINLKARLNSGSKSFYMREIGIYAKFNDNEPVLYAYGYSGDKADYIPAVGGATYIVQDLNLITVIGNAENVSANITAEIGVERVEFDAEKVERINADKTLAAEFDAHINNESNPHKVTKALIELGNVDNTSDKDKPLSDAALEALGALSDRIENNEKYKIFYGTCATLAYKNEKIVTCEDFPEKLTEGLRIQVTFPYGNTVSSVKLKINGNSVPVYFPVGQSVSYDNSLIGKGVIPGRGTAEFVYSQVNSSTYAWIYKGVSIVPPDGSITAAKLADDVKNRIAENEKFKIYYGACDSVHGNSDKYVACPEFGSSDLVEGARIEVVFNHGNTSNYMTLNVNNTGAKYTYFPIGSYRAYNSPEIAKCIVGGIPYEFVYMSGTPDGEGGWVCCGATNIPADGSVTMDRLAEDVQTKINSIQSGCVPATIVIAASNSKHKKTNETDYVCTGTNDQTVLQDAVNALPLNGGKIILLEGTYNFSSRVTCNKNVVFEGMGQGTQINCNGHKFLYTTMARDSSMITIKDIYFNCTGTFTQSIPFISSTTNLLIDNCKINVSISGVSQTNHNDYISMINYGYLTIRDSFIHFYCHTTVECMAFVGKIKDYCKAIIDNCKIDVAYECSSSTYYTPCLYLIRSGYESSDSHMALATVINCLIYCGGTSNHYGYVARDNVDIMNCNIRLAEFGGIYSNDYVEIDRSKFDGNTVHLDGSNTHQSVYIGSCIVTGNQYMSSGYNRKLMFINRNSVVTGNRFIMYSSNYITTEYLSGKIIFTNNLLSHSQTVSNISGSVITNNIVI